MSLQAAIDAVRDESLVNSTGARATRGRVLAAVERSPRRRLHAVVAAVIASMFGASAFAWYARGPQAPRAQAPALAVTEPVLLADETPPPAVRFVATVDEAPAPPQAAERPAPQPGQPAAAVAIEAQPDPELALYAAAHAIHFKQHDMLAALDAWNRYLAAAPNGRLAPEARFNRLVALVRLDRWDEAAREVATFDDPAFRPTDIVRLRALIERHRR